jgi:dUTP pyrophosphatase
MENILKIKKLDVLAKTPEYMSEGAAGFDISACLADDIEICMSPGKMAIVPTGLSFEIPPGFEAQVRPRSGLAFKSGITIVNAPGTIDSDYRGEVKVCLMNLGTDNFVIKNGDRVAQVVLSEVPRFKIEVAADLTGTKRGSGGFGSTGR